MEWLITLWKTIVAIAGPLKKVFAKLRSIPVVDDFVSRNQQSLFSPVVIRRIRNPKDPDLYAALDLYEKRISGEFRFQGADIIRWLTEDRRLDRKDISSPRDYFLVAKFKKKVCAFILFHYYPSRQIVFFAYMVVQKNIPGLGANMASNALIDKIGQMLKKDNLLKGCETLLFEVEDPRKSGTKAKQLEAIARVQRFCLLAESQQLSLRSYDVEYYQPQLVLPEDDNPADGEPLLLLLARPRGTPQDTDPRAEIIKILSFLYLDLYPQGFSPILEEQTAYRAYCAHLYDMAVEGLPTKVKILNPVHLTCGRKIRRASQRTKEL